MSNATRWSGFLQQNTNTGENPFPEFHNGLLKIPRKVELLNGALIWEVVDSQFITKEPEEGLIIEFANLAFVEAETILQFAQTWGVLGLCKHNLPATHNPPIFNPKAMDKSCKPTGSESIELWHKFARMSRAVLSLASHLHRNEKGKKQDWIVLSVSESSLPEEISGEKSLLVRYMNVWVDIANVRPRIQWNPAYINISYPLSNSLFGALTVELMRAVVRTHGPVICASCGNFYKPPTFGRRPRANQRNYCYECGKYAARRDASREYRKRKKGTK
ncbi:MAG TPA: hypothetical protein VJS44_08620 [Pyrinomonadaceae bacterium]|nr:hypothetical protein [Pyrinomonadaceae bacterium]